MKSKTIKFSIQELLGVAMTMVILGLAVAFGLQINNDVKTGFVTNSLQYNATRDTGEGLGNFTEKLGTLATIVVAGTIIGILVTYMYARFVK